MSKNSKIHCIFQKCEHHEFEDFSDTMCNTKVLMKIQQTFLRKIRPKEVSKNVKRCIREANLEGQGW